MIDPALDTNSGSPPVQKLGASHEVVFEDRYVYVMNDVDPEGVMFFGSFAGRLYKCIVTRLALSEHCASTGLVEHHHERDGREECLSRFESNRLKIQEAASRLVRQRGAIPGKVLVTTGDFPGGLKPPRRVGEKPGPRPYRPPGADPQRGTGQDTP